MAWINGQWVDEQQGFGGMLGGFGSQPRFEEGYTGDTSLDVIRGPMQPPPFGDRPGMPNLPPQMNPPGYDRGPQMQPPFGGGLGNIDQWNPLQPGSATQYQPPQMMPPLNIPGRMPAPQPIPGPPIPPRMPAPPVDYQPPGLRPTMPPPPPTIGDVWEPMPPPRPPVAPPEIIRPPIPPRPPVLPPIVDPPKRDTGADARARKLAAQKRAAAHKLAAANKRAATLARQKAAAAAKRAAASKRAGRGRGYPPPPATRTQDVARGPKRAKNITGISRSQRGRGDR